MMDKKGPVWETGLKKTGADQVYTPGRWIIDKLKNDHTSNFAAGPLDEYHLVSITVRLRIPFGDF